MNEKFIGQVIAELRDSQTMALALLTQALCQQVDAERLKTDLRRFIAAAEKMPSTSPIAIRMANGALAAAEAEAAVQANRRAEGHRPT